MKKLLSAITFSFLIALNPYLGIRAELVAPVSQGTPLAVPDQNSTKSVPNPASLRSNIINYSKIAGAKLKKLFSYENQRSLIHCFSALKFLNQLELLILINTDRTRFKKLPYAIKSTLKDMNHPTDPSKISSSKTLGFNAAALPTGSIIVGEELLNTASPQELRFVLGHEIAHLQKKHSLKHLLFNISHNILLISLQDSINRSIHYYKNKYNLDDSKFMGKALSFLQLINNSPLFSAGLSALLVGTMSRSFEKEADLISAATLNNAQAGVDFFKSVEQEEMKNNSTFNWLNPFYIFDKIQHLSWFSSHPSDQERIGYLSEIATQQNSQKVFENWFKNSATLTAS